MRSGESAHEPPGELFAHQRLEAVRRCGATAAVHVQRIAVLQQELGSGGLWLSDGGGVHHNPDRPGS